MEMPSLLPSNLSSQISRQLSRGRSQTAVKRPLEIFIYAVLILFPILGVVMVYFGNLYLDDCPQSQLPSWLLIEGIAYPSLFLLGMLSFCVYLCDGGICTKLFLFLGLLDFLFSVVWYAIGCYWTWSSVDSGGIKKNSTVVMEDETYFPTIVVNEDNGCSDVVLWLAFSMTIAPLFAIFLCCCLVCKEICETELDEEES